MLAAERQSRIVEIVKQEGSAQVTELAKELEVSSMTIRRDLTKLEKENQIERCHGGAVAKQEINYMVKQTSHIEEKKRLARLCGSFVSKDNTVFLDAGTTTFEIAKLILDIPGILIVTNDLRIAQLVEKSNAELILCGGNLQKSTGSMMGYHTLSMLQNLRFDIGFFGASSINDNYQVMTPTADKAFLKRCAIEQCEKSYLVVDDSKFGKNALFIINRLSDYTAVLTNKTFTSDEEILMKSKGVHMIYPPL